MLGTLWLHKSVLREPPNVLDNVWWSWTVLCDHGQCSGVQLPFTATLFSPSACSTKCDFLPALTRQFIAFTEGPLAIRGGSQALHTADVKSQTGWQRPYPQASCDSRYFDRPAVEPFVHAIITIISEQAHACQHLTYTLCSSHLQNGKDVNPSARLNQVYFINVTTIANEVHTREKR